MTSRYLLPSLVGSAMVLVVIGIASSGRVTEAELSLEERCSEMGGEWLYRSADQICLQADGTRLAYNAAVDDFILTDENPEIVPVVLAAETEIERNVSSCNQTPEFNDYRTDDVFDGRARVDFSTNDEARLYRTAISKDVSRGVNFAGKYVVSTWGCGAGCVGSAVVNVETGQILSYGLRASGYEFERGSSLLNAMELGYYSIKDDELIQVCN